MSYGSLGAKDGDQWHINVIIAPPISIPGALTMPLYAATKNPNGLILNASQSKYSYKKYWKKHEL